MKKEDFVVATYAILDSDSISVMTFPACDKTLKENEVIIQVDGCNKKFKISIEEI